MPLSKDLSRFPVENYMTLMLAASKKGEVTFNCADKQEATRTRHEIYHVRNLIFNNKGLHCEEPYLSFVAAMADKPITILLNGPTVTLRAKPSTVAAVAAGLLEEDPTLLARGNAHAEGTAAPQTPTSTLSNYGLNDNG